MGVGERVQTAERRLKGSQGFSHKPRGVHPTFCKRLQRSLDLRPSFRVLFRLPDPSYCADGVSRLFGVVCVSVRPTGVRVVCTPVRPTGVRLVCVPVHPTGVRVVCAPVRPTGVRVVCTPVGPTGVEPQPHMGRAPVPKLPLT